MSRDIRKLLEQMAAEEAQFRETTFLAPCARGGRVRVKIGGLAQTYTPQPPDFEGWGLFKPKDTRTAELVEEAGLPQIANYCARLTPLRLRLVVALQGQTWLAYPVNESDARQRLGDVRPLPVHLVTEGGVFEPIVARGGDAVWWFEEVDRRADPMPAEHLKTALSVVTLPENLHFKGITPEMRTAYALAAQQSEAFREVLRARQEGPSNREEARDSRPSGRDGERLQNALRFGGGDLRDFRDRGDYWQVEWMTRDGQRHTSAISKRDLTVLSAGICLSDQDTDFDLQSLVGVIEQREW